MPCLNEDTSESTEEDLVRGVAEAVEVAGLAGLLLLLERSLDVLKFQFNFRIVDRKACETAERFRSSVLITLLDPVTRRLTDKDYQPMPDRRFY